MRYLLAGLALAASFAAGAQSTELRKCIGPKGQVSYTQSPCPAGWKLHHSFYTAPEPPPSAAELQRRELARQRAQAESSYLQQLAGTSATAQLHNVSVGSNPSACDAARANRDRVLQVVGLRRTVDLLRALDEAVFNACK